MVSIIFGFIIASLSDTLYSSKPEDFYHLSNLHSIFSHFNCVCFAYQDPNWCLWISYFHVSVFFPCSKLCESKFPCLFIPASAESAFFQLLYSPFVVRDEQWPLSDEKKWHAKQNAASWETLYSTQGKVLNHSDWKLLFSSFPNVLFGYSFNSNCWGPSETDLAISKGKPFSLSLSASTSQSPHSVAFASLSNSIVTSSSSLTFPCLCVFF